MAVATLTKNNSEQEIDRVNQWMRSQPWYVRQLAAWGQTPDRVNLSKFQANQLVRLAQANGVQVDEGHFEVDPGGNFNPRGHKMRNTLIGLGAGAAVAAPFVLPALIGGAGAAGGAAALPTLGGGSTLAANLAGAGAVSGMSAVPALAGGSTLAANLAGAGALPAMAAPSLAGGSTLASNLAGTGALPSMSGTGTSGGSSIASRVANAATGGGGATDWMRTLAPLLGLGATAATGGFNTPSAGMDASLQKQIEDLIAGQTARGKQSDPIYAAAMQLAGNLAPTSQNNPRLQEAIRDAGSPMPQRQMDPQVAEAYARLMGGR